MHREVLSFAPMRWKIPFKVLEPANLNAKLDLSRGTHVHKSSSPLRKQFVVPPYVMVINWAIGVISR